MLDVNLLRLIAREGVVEWAKPLVGEKCFDFFAVVEIALSSLCAEEKPVLTAGAGRLPFLQESAKRRHAGSRADHDDRRIIILREMKLRFARENRHRGIITTVRQ